MTPASDPDFDKSLTYVRGDSWGGIPELSIEATPGVPPSANLASVRMQWRRNLVDTDANNLLAEISSSNASQINITSVANWTMQFPPQPLDLPAGVWDWGIEFVDVNGIIMTYGQGKQTVLPEVVLPVA